MRPLHIRSGIGKPRAETDHHDLHAVFEFAGLDRLIKASYSLLGLISFLTAGPKEVRAWTICRGWKAPKAAGRIHTDFERGFIRAEVIKYEDYIALGGESACRQAGKLGIEGKEYIVQDGDIMHFLFNV